MASVNAWNDFIKARILQEKAVLGDRNADGEALKILDRLCDAYPQDPWFLKARAWSLSVQNREQEAVSSVIEAAYSALTHQLSGENDVARDWIRELENLQSKISAAEGTKISTSQVAW